MNRLLLSLVTIFLIAGCTDYTMQSGRAQDKVEPLVVEGDAYDMRFLLYEHRELGLSTYVPEGLIVEFDEKGMTFYAKELSGKKFDRTQFRIFQGGETTEQTEELIVNHFRERNVKTERVDPEHFTFSFSLSEQIISLDSENLSLFGGGAVFKRENRFYGFIYHYTGEMGDLFHPVVMKAVDELEWMISS
ncbi:hypothetical protein FE782_14515 [Paenibacillus antri]|uniref:Lipoprotein n=1 Tax=Paenibacillus antri TaxID=2582848 RepID=A0A5R9GER0_9BACL|nr:hypothetical protein [Paenibacillus antri]TLS51704.1 hypothetical protein FE782_14515 [Paenibacillus antri]